MQHTKEEERVFQRRLDAYARARDGILQKWKAAPSRFLAKKDVEDVPDEERALYKEAYDFLLSHGAINFGSVQPPEKAPGEEPEERELSERDIVLALYEILRGVDFQTVTEKAIRKQLGDKLGAPMDGYKRLINKHVNYFVENNGQERDDLQPFGFGEGGELEEGGSKKRPHTVMVVGAGPAGLAAASTLKKCGVQTTVFEARGEAGGRCVSDHGSSSNSSSSANNQGHGEAGGVKQEGKANVEMKDQSQGGVGGADVEMKEQQKEGGDKSHSGEGHLGEGGQRVHYLGELAPMPLLLRPKGPTVSEGGLGSRHAAEELLDILGQQQGLDLSGLQQQLGEGGDLPVFDPATGQPVPMEQLCASSKLLQELILTCQFASHHASLRGALEEALKAQLDKAEQDVAEASEASYTAAAAANVAAAAVAEAAAAEQENAGFDDIMAAAAMRDGGGEEHNKPKEGSAEPKGDGEQQQQQQQQEQQQQQQEQQQQQQQQQEEKAEHKREEQRQHKEKRAQAEQALSHARAAQKELQDAARTLAWQLTAFEVYAGVSLCALPPPAASRLGSALVPIGVTGGPSTFSSLFPAGANPKPLSLPQNIQGSGLPADARTSAARTQARVVQGLGHEHLDIRRGDPVAAVHYGDDGAAVTTLSGAKHTAGAVILAVPLGVLQTEAISFAPPLPIWKTDAHARLGVTTSVCVVLEYESAFWREGGKGPLFGVLPRAHPPPAPSSHTEEHGTAHAAAAAATENAASQAAESGSVHATATLGWVFEDLQGSSEQGKSIVLAHALAAPGTQASKLPDAALKQAAAEALHSVQGASVTGSSAQPATEGDAPMQDQAGGDADFSDFAQFERMTGAESAQGTAEHKPSPVPVPLNSCVRRWDASNRLSHCRRCALPGARDCGLTGDDENENELTAAAAAPLHTALLFAGEHTVQASLVGTVAGAFMSGAREAARAAKLFQQLRMGGEVVDLEVFDEAPLDTGKLKSEAKAREKELRQAIKQKQKDDEKAAKAAKDKARKAEAAAKRRKKAGGDEEDKPGQEDEEESESSEASMDSVEREQKRGPKKKRGRGQVARGKRGRSPPGSPRESEGEEEEGRGQKKGRGRGSKAGGGRRKKSPSEGAQEAEQNFQDPIRYQEQQARRGELRNYLKNVHKALINASKGNVQMIWELVEAAEDTETRGQLIPVLLSADAEALENMAVDVPLLRLFATWIQDLSGAASTEHMVLQLFQLLARMPSRLVDVKESGLLAAVKKLRGNDARKETRAGADELWAIWDKRFKEHSRQAAAAAAQAAAKASFDPLLGFGTSAKQPLLGGPLLQPPQQTGNSGAQTNGMQQQQQQQQQPQQQPQQQQERKPAGVNVEHLSEEDRARFQALEAQLAEDERQLREAEEQRRAQQEELAKAAAEAKLPHIPTFDEYARKRQEGQKRKQEKHRKERKEGDGGGHGSMEPAEPAHAHVPEKEPGAGGSSHTPLYNIVTKMLASAVQKGELQKDRFAGMREKVISKIVSGKSEEEAHSEAYVRKHTDKIKRLVKGYIDAKQSKGEK